MSQTSAAGDLRRLIASLVVVRASGHLADHQRRYPRWELPNAELASLLEASVAAPPSWPCAPASCADGPPSPCCSAPMWRRGLASGLRVPAGWCRRSPSGGCTAITRIEHWRWRSGMGGAAARTPGPLA